MQTKDLVKVWNAPDNSRLTPKQISIRMPVHVAAKVAALAEMFPKKTKTEIIGDLLATALDDVAEGFSNTPYADEEEFVDDAGEMWGDRRRYHNLVQKHLLEIDAAWKEVGIEDGVRDKALEPENRDFRGGKQIEGGSRTANVRRAPTRRRKK